MGADHLRGGGVMGAAMRDLAWEATPLGACEAWPQSLRTSVSTCLASRFPILLCWGPELVMLYNDAYRQILGAKHPAALGQPGEAVWPEVWHIVGPMLRGVLAGGEATWSERQMLPLVRRGFTEECYFTFSYSPIQDETGGVGGVFTAVTEVTAHVLFERRLATLHTLAHTTAAAATVPAAFRAAALALAANPADVPCVAIYEVAGDAVRLAGAHGVPGAPAACALAAAPWQVAEVVASGVARRVPVGTIAVTGGAWPEPPAEVVVQPVLSAGAVAAVVVTGVSPRLPLDEAYRHFHELLAGHLGNAVSSARAHEQERARAASLAELDRARTAFFSNISHELRTPLTLILGPTRDALEAGAALEGDGLRTVHRNAQRLHTLVNQLLDFARIEARRAVAQCQPVDLAALTTELVSVFTDTVERGGLALRVDCPPLAGPVLVDPEMWENLVSNLLSNAFKFTFHGAIAVSLRDAGDDVELRVRDTGVGIPPEHLPRIFERFYRTETRHARSHEGTGIGLALVKDLVELHGGRVAATSELGVGTEIVVTLPRRSPAAAAAAGAPAAGAQPGRQARAFADEAWRWLPAPEPAPAAPPVVTSPGGPGSLVSVAPGARILLADDSADMRAYVARLLAERWEVTTVADGAQALARARAAPPDLIVADVMMPGLDGFGLIAALRADARTARIPVLLLSARAGEEAVSDGLRAGAADYVIKPFTASALIGRVEAQLASTRARDAAAAERQRLFTALLSAPAALCVIRGPDLVIDVANPRCLETWGRTEEVVGRPLLEAMPELASQPFPDMLREVLATGAPMHVSSMFARIDRHGRRDDVYFDFVYEPVREADGTVGSVLVFAVEVTEQVRARRAVEAALAEARDASRAKDEFLALLGHELRNPLAPILTALELMSMRGDQGVTREREVISRQANHLVRLVDDLLDVARISRGTVTLKVRCLAIDEVIARSIETTSPLFEERRHHLDVAVSPGLYVEGDGHRLEQVFTNLLTNAAKYSPPRSRVQVTGREEGGQVVVTVRDEGVGIAPDVLPHVFEMFTQERQSLERSKGGLGLGLAIVRALVELHGGQVAAHSAGKHLGAEFAVRLPLTAPGASAVPRPTGRRPPLLRELAGRRILVVDDNVDAAALLAEGLRALGHETRLAFDGVGALRELEQFTPDLALLDIGLPVMDGYELARRMRARAELQRLHLVAVTGYGQPSDRDRSRTAGFDAHVVKPVELDRLCALIDQLPARAG